MNAWMNQWFKDAHQTGIGGIVRRSVASVHDLGDIDAGVAEARLRGWHLLELGDQYLLMCNPGEIRILT